VGHYPCYKDILSSPLAHYLVYDTFLETTTRVARVDSLIEELRISDAQARWTMVYLNQVIGA
jgi:hypothetical protein